MKVIILAGGFGTRLSELTGLVPKPMIEIGRKPILWHIMQIYSTFGHRDFHLACGYKQELIKDYFLNYRLLNSDFSINLGTGSINTLQQVDIDWRVTMVDTGEESLTGERLRRMKSQIKNETFMLTYGDGLANIDIDALVSFHRSHGKVATVTAVRPPTRFGELEIRSEARVASFQEKPRLDGGWINGGFFVLEPTIFDYISGENIMFEREPLSSLAEEGELMAYFHNGFWQCMDTKRDHDQLERLWHGGAAPWLIPERKV